MTPKLFISADDVLSGKVDPASLGAMYVGIYHQAMVSWGFYEKLLEAVNHMAKFGWRLRGCLEHYCIMEKAGSA